MAATKTAAKKAKAAGKSSKGKSSAGKKQTGVSSERCWEGYEPVPGKKPFSKGSCKPKE